jgi:hypothetical protein
MAQRSETHKRSIRSVIFIVIVIAGISGINFRNNNFENIEAFILTADINVFVIEKPLKGLTENLICEDCFIKIIEKQIEAEVEKRLSALHLNLDSISSEKSMITNAWTQSKGNKNFIIVKQKYRETVNSTSIIGIKGANLIQITGYSPAYEVPYTHGPCAKRMKDVFGFSLKKKIKTNEANTRS